jgi:hypothetical protein
VIQGDCEGHVEAEFAIAGISWRATRAGTEVCTERSESRIVHTLLGSYAAGFAWRQYWRKS